MPKKHITFVRRVACLALSAVFSAISLPVLADTGAKDGAKSIEIASTSSSELGYTLKSGDDGLVTTEKDLRKAFFDAPTDGTSAKVKLGADITLDALYAAENFGSETLADNAAGDTFNRYKIGVRPTAEDPTHWNPLVVNQSQEVRVVYGAYYHAQDERIARLVVKEGQKIVLDLNGHTIAKNARATHGDWTVVCTDIIGNYGTLKIVDTSTGAKGTVRGIGYNSCSGAVLHNYAGATMTVAGVNVDGNAAGMSAGTGQYVISNDGGTLTIDDANVYDTATSASLVVTQGGTVTIKGNATLKHPASKAVNVKGGEVTVESATIVSDNYAIYAKAGTIRVNGLSITGAGTVTRESDAATVVKKADVKLSAADGFRWVEAEDGTQVLAPAPADPRTLGYATSGSAEALPTAPEMGGTVVNVTAAQAQYVLDGAYGSIDGKTINFTESIDKPLVLGRASKYDGSGTLYRHGGHDGEPLSYVDFVAYKNQSTWTESCYYERTVTNVTFTAGAGVKLKGLTAEGGAHVYGTDANPIYDHVRDTGVWCKNANESFYKRTTLKNLVFDGLTFIGKVDFGTSESKTVYDGITFTGCTFELGNTASGNTALRYYNENATENVRNLVVNKCAFKTCYQGVYTQNAKGLTITGCSFDTTGHNAIAVQDSQGAFDHGAVVITDNTFAGIGDRVIRFNNVGSGTSITIKNNTVTDAGLATEEAMKATSFAEGVTFDVARNDWKGYLPPANVELRDPVSVAKIGKTTYATLQAALDAAQAGETVTLLADVTQESGVGYSKDFAATLDLGGYVLKVTNDTAHNHRAVKVTKGTLTVQNGKIDARNLNASGEPEAINVTENYQRGMYGTVRVESGGAVVLKKLELLNNHCWGLSVKICDKNSRATIEGCTFTSVVGGGIEVAGGSATLTGCTFNQTEKSTKFPYISAAIAVSEGGSAVVESSTLTAEADVPLYIYNSGGTLTVNGGTYTSRSGTVAQADTSDGAVAPSKIEITGGTFKGEIVGAAGSVVVSGGTFSTAVDSDYCAVGFVPTKNADGTFGVKEGTFVAQVGTKKYATIPEAIDAAQNGDTITMLADFTQVGDQLCFPAKKTLTLDLNGRTLKVSKYTNKQAQVEVSGELTVTDSSADKTGSIRSDYTGTSGQVVHVAKDGKLTLAGGTITSADMDKAGNAVNIASGGVVTMTGGTIRCAGKRGNYAVRAYGTFTMTGGRIVAESQDTETYITAVYGSSSSAEISIGDNAIVTGPTAVSSSSSKVNITGGTFSGIVDCSSSTTITGGTFSGKVKGSMKISGGDFACEIAVNKGVSGGKFDREVPKTACAACYEPVKNGNETYGVQPFPKINVGYGASETVSLKVSSDLLNKTEGTTSEEKAAALSQTEENGNPAWVNRAMGLESNEKVRAVDIAQNSSTANAYIAAPVTASTEMDAKVSYSVDEVKADGETVLAAGTEKSSGNIGIALAGIDSVAYYRVNVFVRAADGTYVKKLVSENTVGVTKTTTAAKKAIIPVSWQSLADGGDIAVSSLVKTAALTKGDKLHVYNKAEQRYDVYELTKEKAWAPMAIYAVGADGSVATESSGKPESTRVARGSGVWLERQNTTQPIVSYGQVPTSSCTTTVDAGTSEKPTWNLLAVPATAEVKLAETFGANAADRILVPTEGAPKVYTVESGAWGVTKTVEVTDRWGNKTDGVKVVRETAATLPSGTGFWYLNGGDTKTVNW